MPHEHGDYGLPQSFVGPFGELVWSQRGVRVAGPSRLRSHFVTWPDASVGEFAEDELQASLVKDIKKLRRRLRDVY